MGTKLSVSYEGTFNPETAPRVDRPPTFDPLYGFPKGRKPREMKATWQEMEDWDLTIGERDYCAHFLIEHKRCQVLNLYSSNFRLEGGCGVPVRAFLDSAICRDFFFDLVLTVF